MAAGFFLLSSFRDAPPNSGLPECGIIIVQVGNSRLECAGPSTLHDFLKEQGKLEEFQAIAIKEVLAWQIAEAMKANNIPRSGLATKMKTSRSQIGRLLDPTDGNVTLATLQPAARMVGRKLRLELI
jgi:hypothetical protein